MNRSVIAGAAIAALLLFATRARAAGNPYYEDDPSAPENAIPPGQRPYYHDPVYDAPAVSDVLGDVYTLPNWDLLPIPDVTVFDDFSFDTMPAPFAPYAPDSPVYFGGNMSARVAAFLWMIRVCENYADDVASNMDYQTAYGRRRFFDMSDHPAVTGELPGLPLPPEMCRAAGFASGKCVSTAAGAYQMTKPTWLEMKAVTKARDFSPANQDAAAVALLRARGILPYIEREDLRTAIRLASQYWASLPGSTAGQNPKTLDFALRAYNDGLANLA